MTLILAMLLPAAAMAAEHTDTTFVVNDKQITVSDSAGRTRVSVYTHDGTAMTRTYETAFADGQEIERVYVTSPFIPQTFNRNYRRMSSHYPSFFMGFNCLPGNVMGSGGNDEMHSRDSKSWEWGITIANVCFRMSARMGLTSAMQLGQVHNHFQDNRVLTTVDGTTTMRIVEDAKVRKSYISYNYIRIPLMAEWQKRIGSNALYVAAGPSVEMRWNDHSRYFAGKKKHTETADINMNPLGLNLDFRVGYGGLMVYGRAALTPLLKTSNAPECYPVAFGVGLRI